MRNKLKVMNNRKILPALNARKLEVLFLEDEFIHDEINNQENLTPAERAEIRETLERISEVYLNENFIKELSFVMQMPNLKVLHLGTPTYIKPTTKSAI